MRSERIVSYGIAFSIQLMAIVLLGPLPAWGELVGHWSFEETGGTSVEDATDFGNDGSFVGPAVWGTGVFGQALELTGSNYVEIADDPILSITGPLTIAAWAKFSNFDAGPTLISKHYNGEFDLTFWNGTTTFYNGPVWNAGNAKGFPPTLLTDTWYHIVITRDANKVMKYYLDGADTGESFTAADFPPDTTNSLFLGARPGGGNRMTGWIDEVYLFNEAIGPDKVAGLYELNVVVPEPSSPVLGLLGVVALVGVLPRRRRGRGR